MFQLATSQKSQPNATPIPASIRKGKKRIPRHRKKSSSSPSNSQLQANIPAKILMISTPIMATRSLETNTSRVRADSRIKQMSFTGSMRAQPRVGHSWQAPQHLQQSSPQQTLQHYQQQSQHSWSSGLVGSRLPCSSWLPQWRWFHRAPQTQQNWQPHLQVMWLQPELRSTMNLHRLHCLNLRLPSKNSTSFRSHSPSCLSSRHLAQNSRSQPSHTIASPSGFMWIMPSHSSLGQSLRLGSLDIIWNWWIFLYFFWIQRGSALKNGPSKSMRHSHSSLGQQTSSKFYTLQMTYSWRQDQQKSFPCSQLDT